MVDLDYSYHKFQIGENELISELFGHAIKVHKNDYEP